MLSGLLSLFLAITPLPNAAAGEVAAAAPRIDIIQPESYPAAASDGTNWLVVWSTTNYYSNAIHAMLVDAAGRPLLANDIVLDPGTIGDVAGVAWSGRYYLVVSGGHGGTQGVRVDSSGNLVDAKPFLIHPQTRVQMSPHEIGGARRVAWDGREFVVNGFVETLQTSPPAVLTRPIVSLVGEDGTIINPEIDLGNFYADEMASLGGVTVLVDGGIVRTLSSDAVSPALPNVETRIAAGGSNFLIVGRTSAGVVGRFLDAAGHPIGVEFPVAAAKAGIGTLSVAWDGMSFVVSWTEDGLTLRGTRVRLTGVVVEPAFTIVTDQLLLTPALASGNMGALALWSDPHIADSIVTESGSTAPRKIDQPAPSEVGPLFQSAPILATAGDGSVALAWSESAFNYSFMRFERVTDGGRTAPAEIGMGTAAAVATNGARSLVVQHPDSVTIRAILLDADGRMTSTTDIAMVAPNRSGGNVRAIAAGDGFLIVWSELTTDPDATIYAARVDADGAATAAKQIGSGGSGDALATSRDRVLVVVNDKGALDGFIVAPDLSSVAADPIASVYDLPTFTSAASDGSNFLVSWISHGELVANDYIAARRVDAAGHVIDRDHFIYSNGGNRKFNGYAFWTGENYELVWTEPDQVWGLRIAADGALIDYPAVLIADVPTPQIWSFAQIAGGRVIAAYSDKGLLFTRTFGVLRRRAH